MEIVVETSSKHMQETLRITRHDRTATEFATKSLVFCKLAGYTGLLLGFVVVSLVLSTAKDLEAASGILSNSRATTEASTQACPRGPLFAIGHLLPLVVYRIFRTNSENFQALVLISHYHHTTLICGNLPHVDGR